MTPRIQSITVIGAGTMGHGIAQAAAQAGYSVTLTDIDESALTGAVEQITHNLDGGVERKKITLAERDQALSLVATTGDIETALSLADLCIEAVVEDIKIKQDLFVTMERVAENAAILATNTSSLPLARITEKLNRPERVIGLHFFNPVHIMKLVEVIVQENTTDEIRNTALAIVERMGKEPVVVKDSPGFATSRLGVVIALEAIRMVEQGVAEPAAIDRALELGYKHPVGPLRLTDIVGLDVRLAVAETLKREIGGDHYEPPKLLRDKVAAGELGKKTGKGFYEWEKAAPHVPFPHKKDA
jgi:3-hydroxybutyryl-CoA dehydrogenase